MTRTNLILLGLALLQGLVLLLLAGPFGEARDDASARSRPFLDLDPSDVQGLRMTDEEETFSFARDGTDDAWRFEEKGGFPVLVGKIGGAPASQATSLLSRLAAIEVRTPIAREASSHEVLGVADKDFERRLVLLDAGGGEIARIFVARGSRSGRVHVRRADANEVYETDDLALWDLSMSATEFCGNKLTALDRDRVASLRIRRPDEAMIEISRKIEGEGENRRAGPWIIDAPKRVAADQEQVDDLVRRLCDLSISGVEGREAPKDLEAGARLATIELDLPEGPETFVVEKLREDGDFLLLWNSAAKRARSGYRVLVPAWSLGEAASLHLEDLEVEEPARDGNEEPAKEEER